jgi:hypothetical protein
MKEINGVINEPAEVLPAETYSGKEEAAGSVNLSNHHLLIIIINK